MESNRQLYNHLAERYDLRQQNPAMELLREKELRLIKKYSNGIALDIGCGTGYHLNLVENAIGLDISEKMLEVARQKGRPLVQADAENIPVKPGSIGTVLCFYSTLNFVEYKKAAEEISKALNPGGRALFSVASIRDMDKTRSSQESRIKRFRLEGKPVNMRLFDKEEVVKAFQNCGLRLKKFDSIFRAQNPRWGNFQKFSLWERLKLKLERFFPVEDGRIYFFVFEKN